MNRIEAAFAKKKTFIGFLTAGDPSLEKSLEYVLAMEQAGADIIEIGIPFSDPIAEGPVIQDANLRALRGGFTLPDAFTLVSRIRQVSQVPLLFLTYANPVFNYGYEAFCAKCQEVGLDGLIVPDMPYEENSELKGYARSHNLSLIPLIAPTSLHRIPTIAKDTDGYIYLVSSMGVTGMRSSFSSDLSHLIEEIRKVTDTPIAIGFGIHTRDQVQAYQALADGVIVGSGIVKIIEQYGENAKEPIIEFVKELTGNDETEK
jgi:tryptophan synthase alpha chain